MRKQDFIAKNPLRVLIPETGQKRMSLVMARAGLGKTSILVQIAIDSLMRGQRVLHVSVGQNLEKTRAWYYDILNDMVEAAQLEDMAGIHEDIHRNRLIMTFNEAGFTKAKFEERLNDLVSQNIFRPDCVLVDGFDFATVTREELEGFRELVEASGLQTWVSALCHREDIPDDASGVPDSFRAVEDLFDTVILLRKDPKQKCLVLDVVKDDSGATQPGNILHLDPATLMINP